MKGVDLLIRAFRMIEADFPLQNSTSSATTRVRTLELIGDSRQIEVLKACSHSRRWR